MALYEVELPVNAWVTVEVDAASEAEAHTKALMHASPHALTYEGFIGTAAIKKISDNLSSQSVIEEGKKEIKIRSKNKRNNTFQKDTKTLLRDLVKTLERKFSDQSLENWGYREAAARFHYQTGCSLKSAERYFYDIQDIAEWRHILGRDVTYRDYYSRVGSRPFRLP